MCTFTFAVLFVFFISFETSRLFKSGFSLQVFAYFLVITLSLFSFLFQYSPRTCLVSFQFLNIPWGLPTSQRDMVCLGKCSIGTWKQHGYSTVAWLSAPLMFIIACWLRVFWNSSVSLTLSSWSINYWERAVGISNYNCGFVYLSFQFYYYYYFFGSHFLHLYCLVHTVL